MGIFPNRAAVRRLIGAVLTEQHDARQVDRRTLPALAVDVGNQPRMEPSMLLPAEAAWSISQGDALPPLDGTRPTEFAPCETPLGRVGLVLKLDSLYIHRRGFTTTTTNHKSVLPTSQGAWARSARRACEPYAHAPASLTSARLGSSHQHAGQAPPYQGHKAKFAACETPPGRVGLVLKLDSLYIYIGGVSPPPPPTATNHRCCLPWRVGAPPRARPRARRARGPCARALGVRTNTLGNPTIPGS